MWDGDHKTIAKAIKDRVSLISRKRAQRQQVCPTSPMSHMVLVRALLKNLNTCAADCLKGQRRSREEKDRRRTTASSAARPTVKHGGVSAPANTAACFLYPSTTNPTQPTDIYPTCIPAEPSELQLQRCSVYPTHRHGTRDPLCPSLNWTSPPFSSRSKCDPH